MGKGAAAACTLTQFAITALLFKFREHVVDIFDLKANDPNLSDSIFKGDLRAMKMAGGMESTSYQSGGGTFQAC